MSPFSPEWPLPGQADPNLTPCAFCRRRLRINGQPVFTSCSCKAFGPSVTVGALVAGAVLVAAGAIWLLQRK
ncbi:hypothetical protein ACFPAF_09650 [Hymenobacter endophyticus]|uniref:Uncharacterized protein n=1 Tax=Hymenobacter endophyticus TaxID=3076335 RepID=A0ABU3TH31_9BACT|nr:hypothetical protein [Hymenobacter endophyticus]MDU0370655.1 hypothetical protein [Hymenobacter endophyticus]